MHQIKGLKPITRPQPKSTMKAKSKLDLIVKMQDGHAIVRLPDGKSYVVFSPNTSRKSAADAPYIAALVKF